MNAPWTTGQKMTAQDADEMRDQVAAIRRELREAGTWTAIERRDQTTEANRLEHIVNNAVIVVACDGCGEGPAPQHRSADGHSLFCSNCWNTTASASVLAAPDYCLGCGDPLLAPGHHTRCETCGPVQTTYEAWVRATGDLLHAMAESTYPLNNQTDMRAVRAVVDAASMMADALLDKSNLLADTIDLGPWAKYL